LLLLLDNNPLVDIRTRLNEYLPGMLKFVFGIFYECSKDLHGLVKKIANTLAETKWRDQNFQSEHACRTFYSYVIQKVSASASSFKLAG